MLRHTFDENVKEEPGVFKELADDQLVGLGRSECSLQVFGQFLVHSLLFGTCNCFSYKYILQRR